MKVCLTQKQREALAVIGRAQGKSRSALVREAVVQLLAEFEWRRNEAFAKTAGTWKDRKDLPDFRRLRREWDRR